MTNCRALLTQFFVTFFGNVGPIALGLHIGWFAALQNIFQSELSPLGYPADLDEIGWLAAIPTIGLLAGMPIFGFLMQRAPRKVALFFATVPHAVVFASFATTHDLTTAYVLRFFSGMVCAGSLIVCPVYIGEISQDSLRGFFCGSTPFSTNVGVVVSIVLANYCSYFIYNLLCAALPAVFALFFAFLPESPLRLLSTGNKFGAERTLMFLRGGDEEVVQDELLKLSATLKAAAPEEGQGLKAGLRDAAGVRAILITGGILTIQQICGSIPILTYIVEVIRDMTALDKEETAYVTILVNGVIIIASAFGPFLLLAFGRRVLLIYTNWAAAFALAVLSAQAYFFANSSLSVLPLAAFLAFYTIGLGNVPYVLLPELLPPNIRGAAAGIIGLWVGLVSFSVVKIFPYFSELVGVAGYCLFFCVVNVLCTILLHLMVFETRGLSAEQILIKLRGGDVK